MNVVGESCGRCLGTDAGEGDGDAGEGGFLEELCEWGEVIGCVEGARDEYDGWFGGHGGKTTSVRV